MAENKKSLFLIQVIAICAVLGILISIVFIEFKEKLNQADALNLTLQKEAQVNNNNLKSMAEQLKRTREDLRAAQYILNKANEEKTNNSASLEKEYQELNEAYLNLKNSHAELEKTIGKLSVEKKEIIRNLEDIQAKAKETQSSVKPEDKPDAKLKSQKNSLENKINEQNRTIAKLNSENSRLQEEISKASQRLSVKNSDFDARLRESKELKDEIAVLQDTVNNLEKELFNARIEQAEKNSAIDVLSIQKENLEKENKRKIAVAQPSERIKRLQEQKVAAQVRLSEAQVELSRKNEIIASLEGNIQLLKNGLAQKEQQKKSLESEQQIKIDELNSINDSLKAKLTEFSSNLANKEFELQKSSNKIALLEKEMFDLQMRLKDSPGDNNTLKNNAEALKRQVEGVLRP